MSREKSPYVRDPYWLDKRRDGRSPYWQIAEPRGGTIVYRSTREVDEDKARIAMDAYIDQQKSLGPQQPHDAGVVSMLVNYWDEKGCKLVNSDQTSRSLRTFAAFLAQDKVTAHAVVTKVFPGQPCSGTSTMFVRLSTMRKTTSASHSRRASKTLTSGICRRPANAC